MAEPRPSARLRLGTQGWAYRDWVGTFYPSGTTPTQYLPLYSRVFDTVELDTTFYGPPRVETVRTWYQSTPDGFEFGAKMPRAITHDLRLVGVEYELVAFLTPMTELRSKLGPILIQLPPSFSAFESATLEAFLDLLPEEGPPEFRYAIEFRHASWHTREFENMLRKRRIAWVIADLPYVPRESRLTADFSYIRWLGNRQDVKRLDHLQRDRSEDLRYWADQLDSISRSVQRVYGFMNNHYEGHSPASLRRLRIAMGLPDIDPQALWPQQTLALE